MFTAEDRAVFEYHDGEKARKADPLAIHRALVREAGGDLYGLWGRAIPDGSKELTAADNLAIEDAQEQLVAIVKKVFGLTRLWSPEEPDGLTEAMVWAIFTSFQDFFRSRGRKEESSPPS